MKQFFITALLTLSVTGAVFSQTPISDAKHFYDSTLVALNSGDYDTYLNSISDDIQAFIGSDVFPTFEKIGIKYFMTINAEDAVASLTVSQYSTQVGPNGMELLKGSTAEGAIEWLKK